MPKSYLNLKSVVVNGTKVTLNRGFRNNNPGNLRRLPKKAGKDQLWKGEIPYEKSTDKDFSQFEKVVDGLRAMMRDIYGDYNKGLNTVQKLIENYAPPTENNTKAYIQNVAKALGVAANAVFTLNADSMIVLAKAICVVENGKENASLLDDSDYTEALSIAGLPFKKK